MDILEARGWDGEHARSNHTRVRGVLRTEQRMKRATSKRLKSPRLIILLIQRCLRLMARELVTRLIVRWG